MSHEVVAGLQRAKERVAGGWKQGGGYGKNGEGCAVLAITDVGGLSSAAGQALLYQAIFGRPVPLASGGYWLVDIFEWNDRPGLTHVDVLDAFDAAIRLAKDASA